MGSARANTCKPSKNTSVATLKFVKAARALHFYDDQIHWECSEIYANELWPLGLRVKKGSQHGTETHPFRYVLDVDMVLKDNMLRDQWHVKIQDQHDDLVCLYEVIE
jgi:hypothetical protein